MIIYKDIITNDEMFTDSSKVKLVDDCLYEVQCQVCIAFKNGCVFINYFLFIQYVTRRQGEITLEGANPSAEEFEEGTDDSVESGLDLVLNQRLVETGFSKADYKNYIKTYTKALQEKWKENGKSAEEIEHAKTKVTEAIKKILPKLGDYKFYLGESSNPDGMVALLDYREGPDGNEVPTMLFLKHGLEEEKV
ncbi:microtubule-binding protein-like protein [Dinothrombium tinctorium]|uniref:Translationally-controlled tumor protein homolog n=1 Tax=Dinothrombium tinctorium TaxID=1965070 RepID=A0A443RAY6_9ACAR|nr:microtubule-binding protein-like protein [Dinothrombium tinctorium]